MMIRPWQLLLTMLLGSGFFLTVDIAPAQQAAPETESTDDNTEKTAKDLIREAYEATNEADTFDEYNRVFELCEAALAKNPTAAGRKYLMQLSAWALNRRGKERSKQAGQADDAEQAAQLEAQAMADFQEAIRRDADKWQAIHNRGVSYALLGEYDKALSDFNRTIELNPKYPNAWFNRGEIRYQNGQYASAVNDYTQAIQLNPDDAGAHNARAHAYFQIGRHQSAISDFTRAKELAPDNAQILADRADVYANLGYWKQAASDYRGAIELDEDLGRAYMGAAWVMATSPDEQFRDADLAVESATKAIGLDGEDDWRYLDTLAAAQANAGDFAKARATIEKAIAKAPEKQLDALQARLSKYAEDKPFRDTARPAQN